MTDKSAAAAEATEKKTKAKKEAAPKEVKEKVPGIGDKAKELIRAGKSNEEVLAGIKESFPEANTTMASVNWYRNKLRSDGEKIPTARELKPKVEKAPKAPKEKKPRGKKAAAEASEAAQAEAASASHLD